MKRKTFYGFISLILAVVIVIVCGIGSSWFTNGNFKTWFNSWGQGSSEEPPVECVHEYEDGVCTKCGAAEPAEAVLMLSVATYAGGTDIDEPVLSEPLGSYGGYDKFYFEVKVYPENATFTEIDWETEFANPFSDWARGKNVEDYFTLTASEDAPGVMVGELVKHFGEPVTVRAKLHSNEHITATRAVQCRANLSGITVSPIQKIEFGTDNSRRINYELQYSTDGTIREGNLSGYKMELSSDTVQKLEEYYAETNCLCNISKLISYTSLNAGNSIVTGADVSPYDMFFIDISDGSINTAQYQDLLKIIMPAELRNQILAAEAQGETANANELYDRATQMLEQDISAAGFETLKDCINDFFIRNECSVNITVQATCVWSGRTETVSATIESKIDMTAFIVPGENVEIGDGDVVLG